ncbi:zinc finger protein ztf-16-like [Condylostylus longicornis]|uniref:zinc finger protein ztf-16-like n=1 Tax=Condylostylus longicornis TaxID=2530218 RepID=UPI00244DBA4F|nr:zinc finger protein ztf-16-like [Condylostylus longicornis]XP_055381772.1 zinc finger protein ztf-16-like [Condylostylus longicornis]XP_055381773.1 zinc finger protein ztf-16-like [Condylostylus longicornis]
MAKNDTAPEVVTALLMAKISAGIEKVKNEAAELQAGVDKMKKFKCNHCDSFETDSNTIFLEHVLQCSSTAAAKKEAEDGDSKGMAQLPEREERSSSQSSRKLFECDVCLMKFSNGANMRRHKMRHTGVKPYECRVCQKRFFRKDHLAEHFTTHTKTLPYHCPICNRGFQRQIAMRAHFQNEHVGQHDLVKTCPLCSFRAGTMKSLRVHFFNRHGIDLDNPGSSASSSLLLALNPSQSNLYCLPSTSLRTTPTTVVTPSYSDSGESLRSTDNATPPLHFLTPHVEISMTENVDTSKQPADNYKIASKQETTNDSPALPPFVDSNSNISTSSPKSINLEKQLRKNFQIEDTITPSISLIPIKQEHENDEYNNNNSNNNQNIINNNNHNKNDDQNGTDLGKECPESLNNRNIASTIKVSPLKSLLREDLKRRLNAKANNIAVRNFSAAAAAVAAITNNNNNNCMNNNTEKHSLPTEIISCNNIGTSNGMITSSEQEMDMSSLNRNLQCLFCKIEFPDQTLYFLHKGCHSESNPWKCNICGEQCGGVYEFNSHLLSKSHQ